MNSWVLIRRSLRFHARAHFGVVLGAAIGSAALTGALLVGDSVRGTLTDRALSRLGPVHFALSTPDRLFRASLRERLRADRRPANSRADGPAAVALILPGMVSRQDGSGRANDVSVVGVEETSWKSLAGWGWLSNGAGKSDQTIAFINTTLAQRLNAKSDDEILVRILKPSSLGLDAAISPRDQRTVTLRLKVGAIVSRTALGDFSLSARSLPPANLFLPLDLLASSAGVPGAANTALYGQVSTTNALPWLQARLAEAWLPEDAGLSLRAVQPPHEATGGDDIRPFVEITSSRVFLEQPVVEAALRPRAPRPDFARETPTGGAFSPFATNAIRVLTYLANLVRLGDNATPYSMVTAADAPFVPPDMRDDEILVNEWLAADLGARPGDSVELSYFVADSGSRLAERTNSFRVRAIVPLKGMYADRTLMPEFPGLAKAESTHDWDGGFPLVYRIRDKDEAYWKQNRGTPKAFITLAAGQAMWANRFGALTAIRYPVPTNSLAGSYRDGVYRDLLANLNPADLGFRIEPVREQALRGATEAQDFGQLFLGFSFFLVVAALLLMALLFQFGLEERAAEVGTFLALGFTAARVRRLLLLEGGALALLGGLVGAAGGLGHAKALLWALATVWHSAVGGSLLEFHVSAGSLLIGAGASSVVALVVLWLTLRRQARQAIVTLLAAGSGGQKAAFEGIGAKAVSRARTPWLAGASALAALALILWTLGKGDTANAGAFFGAGALLLISGLAWIFAWLKSLSRVSRLTFHASPLALPLRANARRPNRSLATVALLACGCFVIVAIGVFQLDANQNAANRSSGTGGFALLGESTLPVLQDLNTASGRESFGLGAPDLAGVTVVPFRVRAGDEASCLNLNRAGKPRLLGVKPELLAGRFTFTAASAGLERTRGWNLLAPRASAGGLPPHRELPAIGDANSIHWALGKKVGDTLEYTDEQGRPFQVRLAGAVANSVLQGSLIIDEAEFVKLFPNESGYRMFLLDAPTNAVGQVSAVLTRALQDLGLELTPTTQRLNAFNAVQNTYLGTFQVLGGLGLLVGSAGLGVVVLRNVLERRGELAVFLAVGFRRRFLHRLILLEHGLLLALGLGLGLASAAVAVLPAALSPGSHPPCASLALTLTAVLLNGALWTWAATAYALRGNLLDALRNE